MLRILYGTAGTGIFNGDVGTVEDIEKYGVEPDLIFGKLGDMNPYL